MSLSKSPPSNTGVFIYNMGVNLPPPCPKTPWHILDFFFDKTGVIIGIPATVIFKLTSYKKKQKQTKNKPKRYYFFEYDNKNAEN